VAAAHVVAGALAAVLAGACSRQSASTVDYDPLAEARASVGKTKNLEAAVPAMCYTKTGGSSNPCWVCHTRGVGENHLVDWDLQLEYSFSDVALTNRWTNLFADRSRFVADMSDEAILRYVRQDNYEPLRQALAETAARLAEAARTAQSARAAAAAETAHTSSQDGRAATSTDSSARRGSAAVPPYSGYVPDLDFARGFDEAGFARDESGWRTIRFHPFAGSFWPTNGTVDDVFIRLPAPFRTGADGRPSRPIYQLNFALLEAAIASDPLAPAVDRAVEPVDERLIGFDLDGDGVVGERATRIRRLPPRYAGAARAVPVVRHLFPRGSEFLHSLRYLDPDAPTFMARRMKELRYMRKVELHRGWGLLRAYEREADDKEEGVLPTYRGSPTAGLLGDFGWQLQAFIEDRDGRLRLQTEEEHRFCMGCHSSVGVTADQTFSFARKIPGAAGWAVQDLRGLHDRPQVGHAEPEVLTYFRRVQGGDEIRANAELIARFFPGGQLDEAAVRRAAVGGDRDLAWLLAPSRGRALALNKAYLAIVREQSYTAGRDPVLAPAINVHRAIEGNGSTELGAARHVFRDGRLHLVWD